MAYCIVSMLVEGRKLVVTSHVCSTTDRVITANSISATLKLIEDKMLSYRRETALQGAL